MTNALPNPHIWLMDDATTGRAKCGCLLKNDGTGPKVWLCDLHCLTRKLLRALKDEHRIMLNGMQAQLHDKKAHCKVCNLIREAEGS